MEINHENEYDFEQYWQEALMRRQLTFYIFGEMQPADRLACGWSPNLEDHTIDDVVNAPKTPWIQDAMLIGAATYEPRSVEHRHVTSWCETDTPAQARRRRSRAEEWNLPADSTVYCHRCLMFYARYKRSIGEDRAWIYELVERLETEPRSEGLPDHATARHLGLVRAR